MNGLEDKSFLNDNLFEDIIVSFNSSYDILK